MKSIYFTTLILMIMLRVSAQVVKPLNTSDFELQYLVRQPVKSVQNPPALFLFHGSGSNEQDLFSLASQIPDEWLIISVRAPYIISKGHYKWYGVELVNNKITINFSQEEESRKTVLKFIDEIVAFYHVNKNRVVLAGFSQGANIASVVSLTAPEKVAGFAIFSGRFIEEIQPLISNSTLLKSLKCFLAHGSQDNMLPITYAWENQQILQNLGIAVTFSEDTVAHSISPKQFNDFLLWLKQH